MNEKSQECSLLQESVSNVDNELREAEVIKRQLREAESGLKIQGEQFVETKAKLADALSDLDMEKKVSIELSKSLDALVVERTGLITEVIPYACRTLLDSPELGKILAEVISANRDDERSLVLKDLSDKGQIDLSSTSFKTDTEAAIQKAVSDYRCAEFPFVNKLSSDPAASFRDLLQIQPEGVVPVVVQTSVHAQTQATPVTEEQVQTSPPPEDHQQAASLGDQASSLSEGQGNPVE